MTSPTVGANPLHRLDSGSLSVEEVFFNSARKTPSKKQEIIERLNKFRFKNQQIVLNLLQIIDNHSDGEQQTISLEPLGQTIDIENQVEMLQKMKNYLHVQDIVNQILPDFTYSAQISDSFSRLIAGSIVQNKCFFNMADASTIQSFQENFKIKSYYGYYLESVQIDNIENLIILILIEEFMLINEKSKRSTNLVLQYDPNYSPEHLGLLNNEYNCISVYLSQAEQPGKFRLYLLLMYSEMFEGFENSIAHQTGMKKINEVKSSNKSLIGTQTNMRKFKETVGKVPTQYDMNSSLQRRTNYQKESIIQLVRLMDSDNDGRVTADDIRNFSLKNFVEFEPQVYVAMFDEAVSKRNVTFEDQRTKPLTVDEIHQALQFHYVLNQNHAWEEQQRPFRKRWVRMLELAGEKPPDCSDLPRLTFQSIRDGHDLKLSTFKPQINKTKSLINISTLPPKQYTSPYRPQAGMIINNTEFIQEIVIDKETYDDKQEQAFQQMINARFKPGEGYDFQTIKFETQQYYNYANKLAQNPSTYLYAEQNPIYKFVPENLNFQIHSASKQSNRDEQHKRLQSIRFSQGLSSNMLIASPLQQESYSQNLQDIDELDADSLMRTQSFPIVVTSGLKQTKSVVLNVPKIEQDSKKIPAHPPTTTSKDRMKSMDRLPKSFAQIVLPPEPEADNRPKPIFKLSFQTDDCNTLKQKLAVREPVNDVYNPVGNFKFRDLQNPQNKPLFFTRVQPIQMHNPHGMSQHDLRPKQAIDRDQKEQTRIQVQQQMEIDQYMGKFIQQQDWKQYFTLSDQLHNLSDGQRPPFISQQQYQEPMLLMSNILRGETEYSLPFQLCHRPLKTEDKHLFLGQMKDSKF